MHAQLIVAVGTKGETPMSDQEVIQSDDTKYAQVINSPYDNPENSKLVDVSWDKLFQAFDECNLSFMYQETKADGSQSNFFRLENPDRSDA